MPVAILLAGPNGAGKSTLQPYLVPEGIPFINADNIAKEHLQAGHGDRGINISAGRVLVERITELV
jgi:predicted ABC-type ATPase